MIYILAGLAAMAIGAYALAAASYWSELWAS